MAASMLSKPYHGPRVGVPFRGLGDEADGKRPEDYLRAIKAAGGEAVPISLRTPPDQLELLAASLDGFVLPGSHADVNLERYGEKSHDPTNPHDPTREETDLVLLSHAFEKHNPVLAICYGMQFLNVWREGSLVQHIPNHDRASRKSGDKENFHEVRIEPGSRLAELAGGLEAQVNSSHHQSVLRPGRDLGVVASAPDGVIEAVEFIGKDHWVVGVQWHPERLAGDPFSATLFRELIAACRTHASINRE